MAKETKKQAIERLNAEELIQDNNNILVAKFMGGHENGQGKWYSIEKRQREGEPDYNAYHTKKTLKYNNDWNWLMPVVDKIESLGFYVSIMKSNITCCKDGGISPIFSEYNYKDKHKTTYLAVIEFINWYNKQTEWFNNK